MTHYYNLFYDVLLYFCLKYVIILDIVKTFDFYIRYWSLLIKGTFCLLYQGLNMINGKIWLSSPTMHGDEMEYIKEAFDTNWLAPLGPNVTAFESEAATYVGVKHAAALVSGTAALHLAVKLAGVKPGDVVFCSDLTFAAT